MRLFSSDRTNLFFRLTVLAGGAFAVTVLAVLSAAMFGEPQAPANRFLNTHAGGLLTGEVLAIVIFGLLAMAVDRRRALRQMRTADAGEKARTPGRG